MKLEKVEVKAMELSHEPEFGITVYYSYLPSATLLRLNGYLFLDRFRIAFLHEYEFNYGRNQNLLSKSSSSNVEIKDRRIFVATISRQALTKLQEKRNADPKGDLTFYLHIQFVFLESTFSTVRRKDSTPSLNFATLTEEGALLRSVTQDLDHNITIPSSEWIHVFCPKFEQTKYQVFEVPIPFELKDNSDFANRLNAAIHALQEMETVKLAGDWEGVIKESRPVWELMKNKQDIYDLLNNDGFNTDTITAFKETINTLFDFASKFIHREARNKALMAVNTASKEDAELLFNLGVSLVNLVAKKLKRAGK